MKVSYKVALGAIFMALCTIIMASTSIFPFGSFAFPGVAGVLLVIISLELNKKWALTVYLGVLLLSIFLTGDHTAIISFAVLFGYYPILKEIIEKIRKPLIEWIIKIVVFNVAVIVGVGLTILFFGLETLLSEYSGFGTIGIIIFYFICNIVFVVYDLALSRLITFFIIKVLPMLKKLH